eukprot:6426725-Heterocapsa_arctica.AAC.1
MAEKGRRSLSAPWEATPCRRAQRQRTKMSTLVAAAACIRVMTSSSWVKIHSGAEGSRPRVSISRKDGSHSR